MQSNNIGVFLNNTDSEVSIKVNLHNYKILKDNFEKIIVIDIENNFSKKLQNLIINEQNNVYIYITDNNCINDNLSDLNLQSIMYLFDLFDEKYFVNTENQDIDEYESKIIDYNKLFYCKYLTFISDKYIYCNNLSDYFKYIDEHNLDFYSYTDSSEKKYHYQLYFFSVLYKSFDVFKNFILENKNNRDIESELFKVFKNKMPYVKIAYINGNISNNIFYNNKLYKSLFEKNLLQIININILHKYKNDFDVVIYTILPHNFDLEIYKKHEDLIDKPDIFLKNHFLMNGQFENRVFSEDGNHILPNFIRNYLEKVNLLYYYDVPSKFSIIDYKKNNTDLNNLSNKELYFHWINYGKNENRIYC